MPHAASDGSAILSASPALVARDVGPASAADVIAMIADELRETSRRAYMGGLADLARFLRVPTPADALATLAAAGALERHRLAYAWRADMEGRGLSAATVALRLAALRAAWDRAVRIGIASGPLKVKAPRPTPLRDPRGPDLASIRGMLDAAAAQPGVQGLRDVALVGTLATVALRREELVRPRVEDFDADRSRLRIVGKGKTDTEWISLPAPVTVAIRAYLAARGATLGEPLFSRTDHAARSRADALSGGGLRKIVIRLARAAGVVGRVAPHGFRHSAITMALDGTGGDVRRVAKLSRHAKIDTVMRYDDARRDDAGELATMIASAIGSERLRGGEVGPTAPGETPPTSVSSASVEHEIEGTRMGVSGPIDSVSLGESARAER